jgi:UPF0042 nucleotide-binding protein
VYVVSFGYGHQDPPVANVVHDVRWLPNPFRQPEYKDLSGRDAPVQQWLRGRAGFEDWFLSLLDSIGPLVQHAEEHDSRTVAFAFGCQGGHDRSVAVAEMVADAMRRTGLRVALDHLDIHHRSGR